MQQSEEDESPQPSAAPPPWRAPSRTLVLVGLMGAGKTTVGRRLANALGLSFRDADHEIERAAGASVAEIFDRFGEAEFRRGERRVIARLLEDPPHVLATGGGAFMDPTTQLAIKRRAISIWLRADLDTLVERVERRDDRPLLRNADPRVVMQALMDRRYPIYAQAEITVDSVRGPHHNVVNAILTRLEQKGYLKRSEEGLG